MAEDFLPIQTATRPEPAAKPASKPDDAGGVTFGELLDAQAKDPVQAKDQTKDTSAKTDMAGNTGSDETAVVDPLIPAATQAAPAPAPAPAAPAQNAVAMMMAALQSYSTQPSQTAEGAPEPVTTDGGVAAPAANATPAAAAAQPAVPATPTTPDAAIPAAPAAATASTAAAPAAAETAATEAQSAPVTAASATAAPKTAKAAEPATAEASDTETSGDANKTDATKAAAAPAAKADIPDAAAPVAQTAVAAAPVAVQASAPVAAKPTIKPAESAKEPASAPGAERAADDGEASSASTSANTANAAKASGQATSPASAQANAAQANAQANATQANTGADASADARVDAATTAATPSTPSADALVKGGQTADAPKTHPALANASPAVAQVYASMIQRADGRAQRFEIRLDPAELGRVDVRIEVGADKKVHAVLAAHDGAALSDLMRGQKALERALSDAGIDLADGGLQFEMSRDTGQSLNGNNPQGNAHSKNDNANVWRRFSTVEVGVDATAADLAAATRSYRRAASRLDLVA